MCQITYQIAVQSQGTQTTDAMQQHENNSRRDETAGLRR